MGAFVVTAVKKVPAVPGGDGVKQVVGYGTGPASYDTGGSEIDLSDHIKKTLDMVCMSGDEPLQAFKFIAAASHVVAGAKMMATTAAGVQVANAVDLSGTVIEFVAYGTD